MNCDCQRAIEKMLMERHARQFPNAKSHLVTLSGYGFGVDQSGVLIVGCTPYQATADHQLKSGITKTKTEKGNMIWSFCPFCGKSAKVSEPDSYYLQDTRSYVGNCPVWWCKDGNGYTTDLRKAHHYTLQRPTVDVQDMHKLRTTDEQRALLVAREGGAA
jgi:hypothetical protein